MSAPTIGVINARLVRSPTEIRRLAEEAAAEVRPAEPFLEPLRVPIPPPAPVLAEAPAAHRGRGRPRTDSPHPAPPRAYRALAAEDRDRVRAELDTGRTLMAVARTFGVSVSTVSRIATEDAPPRPRGGAIHVKLTAAESLFLAERLPRILG